MKENINNFIVNDEDLNVDQLLDETLTLFGEKQYYDLHVRYAAQYETDR